jgi:hypothetical protein
MEFADKVKGTSGSKLTKIEFETKNSRSTNCPIWKLDRLLDEFFKVNSGASS